MPAPPDEPSSEAGAAERSLRWRLQRKKTTTPQAMKMSSAPTIAAARVPPYAASCLCFEFRAEDRVGFEDDEAVEVAVCVRDSVADVVGVDLALPLADAVAVAVVVDEWSSSSSSSSSLFAFDLSWGLAVGFGVDDDLAASSSLSLSIVVSSSDLRAIEELVGYTTGMLELRTTFDFYR